MFPTPDPAEEIGVNDGGVAEIGLAISRTDLCNWCGEGICGLFGSEEGICDFGEARRESWVCEGARRGFATCGGVMIWLAISGLFLEWFRSSWFCVFIERRVR